MNKLLKFKKEEKRLVKLLYKKGLLAYFDLKEFYWAAYHKQRAKKRKHGRKFRGTVYFPEVHFCQTDYWGESDEHSIVNHIYGGVEVVGEDGNYYLKSITRLKRIKLLQKLPTKINNNKIKSVLKIQYID